MVILDWVDDCLVRMNTTAVESFGRRENLEDDEDGKISFERYSWTTSLANSQIFPQTRFEIFCFVHFQVTRI